MESFIDFIEKKKVVEYILNRILKKENEQGIDTANYRQRDVHVWQVAGFFSMFKPFLI